MAVVVEDDDATRYAEGLQRGEILQGLGVRHAVIALAGDDERRGGKVLHIFRRTPLLIKLRVPRLSFEVEVREPEFLRGTPHGAQVEEPHHRSQTFEPLGLTLQPVHEVAAVAPSHGTHACGVDIRQLCEGIGNLHDILVRAPAPRAADGAAELLSVARRSVWVGIGYDVARTGIDLPVGTVGVHPLHLRSAMDIDDERIFLGRIEAVRLDDEHLHGVTVSPLDPHLL